MGSRFAAFSFYRSRFDREVPSTATSPPHVESFCIEDADSY